jgi:DNA-binding response OmpR family regulator
VLESEDSMSSARRSTGASALLECCRLRPEVVLLDVQLPDIDGFNVCEKITAHAEHPTVIMTSSRDGSDFGPLVSTSGACGFVPKAELSGERVQELLGQ